MMVEVQEEEGGEAGHSRKEGFALPCMNCPTHLYSHIIYHNKIIEINLKNCEPLILYSIIKNMPNNSPTNNACINIHIHF